MSSLPRFTLPLPAAAFLQTYWQKAPLFMPAAASGLSHPDANTLASLAMDEAVESRIVTGRDPGPWALRDGPFEEDDFPALGDNDWTLLVQSVDHALTAVSVLLDSFDFLPSWRVEDIMISYAAEGGSVGPHFDRYDVFLIQASGQRQWQIGQHCDTQTPLRDDAPLRLLNSLDTQSTYTASPGDVLYLPPGVAHHGVALDSDCITWSVGFRAPDYQTLLAEIAAESLAAAPDELFEDSQRVATETPTTLSDDDKQTLIQGALSLIQPKLAEQALYRWLSTPRWNGLEFAVEEDHIREHHPNASLIRHGSTRMMPTTHGVWINGEYWPLSAEAQPLAQILASKRVICTADLKNEYLKEGQHYLDEWIERGFFIPLHGEHHGRQHH